MEKDNFRVADVICAFAPSYSHSIILRHGNALIWRHKFFLCTTKNRLSDPSEILALDFKGEFRRFKSARFQRLSASIGRFSTCISCTFTISPVGKKTVPALWRQRTREASSIGLSKNTLICWPVSALCSRSWEDI